MKAPTVLYAAAFAAAVVFGAGVLALLASRDAGGAPLAASGALPAAPPAASAPAPSTAVSVASAKRTAGSPPPLQSGIRCPDGSWLPLLNGVPSAPPLTREPGLPPLPPVIGKIVDDTGCEWWEHADGSVTTSRWTEVILANGARERRVETVHGARMPVADVAPVGDAGGGRRG